MVVTVSNVQKKQGVGEGKISLCCIVIRRNWPLVHEICQADVTGTVRPEYTVDGSSRNKYFP